MAKIATDLVFAFSRMIVSFIMRCRRVNHDVPSCLHSSGNGSCDQDG
jgi:hypothetical protein